MKILGITGGIGSGKSTVTQCFKKLGATIIDADAIARQILAKGSRAYSLVVDFFGVQILKDNKEIDRKKLAEIVFSDPNKLQKLNEITHPCVFLEMEQQIKNADTELICMDVPLLFSTDFPFHCDKTLAVLAPVEIRIKRVIDRDGVNREEIEARMMAQLSDEVLKTKADYCIMNDQGYEKLQESVQEIYRNMME